MTYKLKYLSLLLVIPLCFCSTITTKSNRPRSSEHQVLKIEMFLNAFGVETDGFPTINATIDFAEDTSSCHVSYYEPWLKEKQYSLSKQQRDTLRELLITNDLKTFKKDYYKEATDQPTSTTTIYFSRDTLEIKDYGLLAEFPVSEFYRIVYDLKKNFR
jgi:hypothetical protein